MKNKIIHKAKGLSDRAVAWIFITPTLLLLLAINIYPLIYAISMSFTNFYANKLGREMGRIKELCQNSRKRSDLGKDANYCQLYVLDIIITSYYRFKPSFIVK